MASGFTVRRTCLLTLAVWAGVVVALGAAALTPGTIEAFDRYVEATEARMQAELAGESPFLWVDWLPDDDREDAYARLRAEEVVIDSLATRDATGEIEIPDGTIHHWVGTVLIPDVRLEQTIALIQDYARYAEIYGPDVQESRVLSRDGEQFRVAFRFYTKKVWTVVLNTEFDVEYRFLDDMRVHVPSRSMRILEVEHPDTPDEREHPEGQDRGTMWALQQLLLVRGTGRRRLHAVRVDHAEPWDSVLPECVPSAVRQRRPAGEADGHPRSDPKTTDRVTAAFAVSVHRSPPTGRAWI